MKKAEIQSKAIKQTILQTLSSKALPTSELVKILNQPPQTISNHLRQLKESGQICLCPNHKKVPHWSVIKESDQKVNKQRKREREAFCQSLSSQYRGTPWQGMETFV